MAAFLRYYSRGNITVAMKGMKSGGKNWRTSESSFPIGLKVARETEDREMHCSRILQPQQKLTVLSPRFRAIRYEPTVKTSLLPFVSIHLVRSKKNSPRRNVLSPTACSAGAIASPCWSRRTTRLDSRIERRWFDNYSALRLMRSISECNFFLVTQRHSQTGLLVIGHARVCSLLIIWG